MKDPLVTSFDLFLDCWCKTVKTKSRDNFWASEIIRTGLENHL